MATKKQLAIKFINDTFLASGKFPSIEDIMKASGSTKSTVASIAATMRDVLGVQPEGGAKTGAPSYYERVVEAAKAGTLDELPIKKSTLVQHLNAAIKKGDLVRKVVYTGKA